MVFHGFSWFGQFGEYFVIGWTVLDGFWLVLHEFVWIYLYLWEVWFGSWKIQSFWKDQIALDGKVVSYGFV